MVKVTPHRYVCRYDALLARTKWRRGLTVWPVELETYSVHPASEQGSPVDQRWSLFEERELPTYPQHNRTVETQATTEELTLWSRAQETALRGLGTAEEQLLRTNGLRGVEGKGRPWVQNDSGWRAIARRWNYLRLRRSLADFRTRVQCLDDEYRPVRTAIETRLREQEMKHRAEQRRIREYVEARKHERMHEVAAQLRWDYRIDESSGVVHVFRANDSSLDTCALAESLYHNGNLGTYTLRWNNTDRREVERSIDFTFETWWRTVTPSQWTDSRHIPRSPKPKPGSTYKRSGPSSNYGSDSGGGSGFGGHSGGGSSHGGGGIF